MLLIAEKQTSILNNNNKLSPEFNGSFQN